MKEKLLKIQLELKAPKSQYNSYGKYKYRNCEDILEAVKPLCGKYNCVLKISDELINIGDRYYVKATATLMDVESDKTISTEAYAREALDKKGMDESQITGAASSYARKYALNGLFNIDDTKDADSQKVDEQKEIVNKVNQLMILCDELEKKIEKRDSYQDRIMQAIIKQAFTTKIETVETE